MLIKEAKFTLDKPNSEKPTYIFLRFSCADGQLVYSTQQTISPAEWDTEYQRPKGKNNKRLFSEIERIAKVVADYRDSCKDDFKPVTKEGLINELQKYDIGKKINKTVETDNNKNLFVNILNLIKEAEDGIYLNPKNGRRFEPGTIRNWKKLTVLIANTVTSKQNIESGKYAGYNKKFKKGTVATCDNLKSFIEEYKPDLSFDDITLDFINEIVQFCNKRNNTVNYTGTVIKNLKALMKEFSKRGLHNNFAYKDFRNISEYSVQVYLPIKELEQLATLDLTYNKTYEQIRDRFIMQSFTGLRISDMKKLNNDNIYLHQRVIHNINKKTGRKVVIPIHDKIYEILEKYDGQLPKQFSKDVINTALKVICKEAGINEEIRYIRTEGGRKVEYVKQKWEMVSTHTARRSMVVNMLEAGISINEAMPVTGMSLQTLIKYNRITPEHNAANIIESGKFFRKASQLN
jgi:integrase